MFDFDVKKIVRDELIHFSIAMNKSDILQFLLQYENINQSEKINENMMYSAIQLRHFNCLKVLIDNGFKFKDVYGEFYNSPLEMCVSHHLFPAIKYYVEIKGEIITGEMIYYAIDTVFNKNTTENTNVMKYLINHVSNEELYKRFRRETLIHTLSKHINIEITRLVLEKGINVNSLDDEGHSALYWLSFHNKPNDVDLLFCELLYEYGLNINMECFDCKGQKVDSILGQFIQTLGMNLLVIEWLLQHGARTDVLKYSKPNKNNETIRDAVLKMKHKKLADLFAKYAS